MVNTTLTIKSLNFNVKNERLLKNIDCQFQGNQVVTLLGPNGAGKSTLLKCLAAQTWATNGQITLNQINVNKDRQRYLKQIGYMPENGMIIPELTVMEQLQLIAESKLLSKDEQAIDRVIQLCKLSSVTHKRTLHLSLGYRQRLNLAQALINEPVLLIMDEPLNGLDPHLIIELRQIMSDLKSETLIIMSTHYLAEAHTIGDRVMIMQDGQVLDNIAMSELADGNVLEQLYLQHTREKGAIK